MALIEGTPGAESLVGTYGDDRIYGFDGNDTLDGLDGNDRLYGGLGDDLIRTGYGTDRAWGDAGNDTLRGGGGGDQTLWGGAGDDWVLLGVDRTFGGPFVGTGYGGAGNDLLQLGWTDSGHLFGGSGRDTARLVAYSTNHADTTVNLVDGLVGSSGRFVTFDSIERLEFFGDFGNHTVTGGALDDVIYVGTGNDSVSAGAGDDIVGYRPWGSHVLDGGAGNDLLVLEGLVGSSVYFVVGADGSVDDGNLSQITGFERYFVFGQGPLADLISLGAGDDTGQGFGGNDTLFGGEGDDWLEGKYANDILSGDAGKDVLAGGFGNDTLYGGQGRDHLGGGVGDDVLFGGTGGDKLKGGAGVDTLTGGGGADWFVFARPGDGVDLVTDFQTGQDMARISAQHLPDPGAGGFLASGAVAPDRFSVGAAVGAQAQFVLGHEAGAGETVLYWDADGAGAGAAVALVRFLGVVDVTAADLWVL